MAFPTDNPVVVDATGIRIDSLTSIQVTEVTTPPDEIRYILEIDGIPKWWDGSTWATSAGTYAESNAKAEINANAASIPIADLGSTLRIWAFLHSDDGSTTPELEAIRFNYDPAPLDKPADPRICNVFGFIRDAGQPVQGAVIRVIPTPPEAFILGQFVIGTQGETVTRSDGSFEIELFETETSGKTVDFSIVYTGPSGLVTELLPGKTIPNQDSIDFEDLS